MPGAQERPRGQLYPRVNKVHPRRGTIPLEPRASRKGRGAGSPSVLPHPWQAAEGPCPHQAHPDQTPPRGPQHPQARGQQTDELVHTASPDKTKEPHAGTRVGPRGEAVQETTEADTAGARVSRSTDSAPSQGLSLPLLSPQADLWAGEASDPGSGKEGEEVLGPRDPPEGRRARGEELC